MIFIIQRLMNQNKLNLVNFNLAIYRKDMNKSCKTQPLSRIGSSCFDSDSNSDSQRQAYNELYDFQTAVSPNIKPQIFPTLENLSKQFVQFIQDCNAKVFFLFGPTGIGKRFFMNYLLKEIQVPFKRRDVYFDEQKFVPIQDVIMQYSSKWNKQIQSIDLLQDFPLDISSKNSKYHNLKDFKKKLIKNLQSPKFSCKMLFILNSDMFSDYHILNDSDDNCSLSKLKEVKVFKLEKYNMKQIKQIVQVFLNKYPGYRKVSQAVCKEQINKETVSIRRIFVKIYEAYSDEGIRRQLKKQEEKKKKIGYKRDFKFKRHLKSNQSQITKKEAKQIKAKEERLAQQKHKSNLTSKVVDISDSESDIQNIENEKAQPLEPDIESMIVAAKIAKKDKLDKLRLQKINLFRMSKQETKFTLFHIIGKFIYAKRLDLNSNKMQARDFKFDQKMREDPPFYFDVLALIKKSKIPLRIFHDLLYSNFLSTYANASDAAQMYKLFSLVDCTIPQYLLGSSLLNQNQFGSFQQEDFRNIIVELLGVGVIYLNRHSAESKKTFYSMRNQGTRLKNIQNQANEKIRFLKRVFPNYLGDYRNLIQWAKMMRKNRNIINNPSHPYYYLVQAFNSSKEGQNKYSNHSNSFSRKNQSKPELSINPSALQSATAHQLCYQDLNDQNLIEKAQEKIQMLKNQEQEKRKYVQTMQKIDIQALKSEHQDRQKSRIQIERLLIDMRQEKQIQMRKKTQRVMKQCLDFSSGSDVQNIDGKQSDQIIKRNQHFSSAKTKLQTQKQSTDKKQMKQQPDSSEEQSDSYESQK